MAKNWIGCVFSTLTRALMTMSFCGCIYLLRTVVQMIEQPSSALQLYHSFPELAEHIVAGVLFYVIFGFLFTKAVRENEDSV